MCGLCVYLLTLLHVPLFSAIEQCFFCVLLYVMIKLFLYSLDKLRVDSEVASHCSI